MVQGFRIGIQLLKMILSFRGAELTKVDTVLLDIVQVQRKSVYYNRRRFYYVTYGY